MIFKVFDLGLVEFEEAYRFQQKIFTQVKSGIISSALIICRHFPVITLGRRPLANSILASREELFKKNIMALKTERGGDVTYHGPGQITAYPIFNLNYLKKDIHWFIRQLEQVVMDFLSDLGIKGQRQEGLTGVWVKAQKIASMGIAIRNWITFHGLSINIKEDDLENFKLIRPCGMDIKMTSLETLLGRELEIADIKESIISGFNGSFRLDCRNVLSLKEEILR